MAVNKKRNESRHFYLKNVRVNFPRLFNAELNQLSGKEEYSVQVILDKDNEEHMKYVRAIDAARRELAEANWGDRWETLYEDNRAGKNTRFLREDRERGYYFINLKRRKLDGAPVVVWRNGEDDLKEEDGKPRSGDFCNVSFDMWTYLTPQGMSGWSGTLLGVQYVKEGDPLGGARAADRGEFDDQTEDVDIRDMI